MADTTTTGIVIPSATDNVSPFQTHFAAMATSLESIKGYNTPAGPFVIADTSAITALVTGLASAGYTVSTANPIYVFRQDTKRLYQYDGTNWAEIQNLMGPYVIANAAEITGIIASLSAVGYTVSNTNPITVYRQDTPALYKYDGTNWKVLWTDGDSGWTTVTVAGGFTAVTPIQWRRKPDGTVCWRGRIQSTNFTSTGIKTLVSGSVPAAALPGVYTDSYCPLYANQASMRVTALVGNGGNNLQVIVDVAGSGTPEINIAALRYEGA